jgi:hypothetical protein
MKRQEPPAVFDHDTFSVGKVEGLVGSCPVTDEERETSLTATLLLGIARSMRPWPPSSRRHQELSTLFL